MKFQIVTLLILSLIFVNGCSNSQVDAETAKCIASKSKVYISSGCSACNAQKEIFGNSFSYLNVIDCKINPQECIEKGVTEVPTWFFGDKKVSGVQTEERLKEYTEC